MSLFSKLVECSFNDKILIFGWTITLNQIKGFNTEYIFVLK